MITVSEVFIDKISILLEIPNEEDKISICNTVQNHKNNGQAKSGYQKGYKLTAQYLNDDISFCGFRISCMPNYEGNRFIRIEYNPTRNNETHAYEIINEVLPNGIEQLHKEGSCSRIDITVDIKNTNINELIVGTKFKTKTKIFYPSISESKSKAGVIETIQYGKQGSDSSVCRFYDKVKEIKVQNSKKSKNKVKVPTQEITRVEYELRESLNSQQLLHLMNPFLNTRICERSVFGNKTMDKLFINTYLLYGLCGLNNDLGDYYEKKYKSLVSSNTPEWWKPNEIWDGWNDALETAFFIHPNKWN